MANKEDYEPPGVGTVFPLRSKHAEDFRVQLVRDIGSALKKNGLINNSILPSIPSKLLKIKLSEYLHKYPLLKHTRHWIDGGKQVAMFQPDTNLPFFFNSSGSKICRLCNGKNSIENIISLAGKKRNYAPKETLVKDLMKFLLLLEELDLIQLVG